MSASSARSADPRAAGARAARVPRSAATAALLVAAALVVAALLAGCGGDGAGGTAGAGTGRASGSADPNGGQGSATASGGGAGSGEAAGGGSASGGSSTGASAGGTGSAPGASPGTEPATDPAALVEPLPSLAPTIGGEACSGLPANRSFYAGAAEGVAWRVYCAVLPEGWIVQDGSYRLADGGRLQVAYVAPDGGRFELREGAICAADPDCRPSGTELGQTAFGDRLATLLARDGGGYAAVIDGGAPISWVAYGANLDEPTFRGLLAALLPVAPATATP